MRTLLFKARRTDNQTLIEGLPHVRIGNTSSKMTRCRMTPKKEIFRNIEAIKQIAKRAPESAKFLADYDCDCYGDDCEVDFFTVSQYIGVHDKNWVRVFEHDIVTAEVNGKKVEGIIVYHPDTCSYVIRYGKKRYHLNAKVLSTLEVKATGFYYEDLEMEDKND